jgi:hypothetical protein
LRISVLVCVLLFGACGAGPGSSAVPPTRIPVPAGRVALPDAEPLCPHGPPPGVDACVWGTVAVHGRLHEDGGCIWIERENGAKQAIVWPFGYSAQPRPFVVFDNGGREVAGDGDYLLGGGFAEEAIPRDACGRTEVVALVDPVQVGITPP